MGFLLSGIILMDHVHCVLLIARNAIKEVPYLEKKEMMVLWAGRVCLRGFNCRYSQNSTALKTSYSLDVNSLDTETLLVSCWFTPSAHFWCVLIVIMYAEGDLKYRKVLNKSVIKNVHMSICHPKIKRNYILHKEKRPILRPLSETAKSHFTHYNKEKNKYIHK